MLSYFRNARKRDCRGTPVVQKRITKCVSSKKKKSCYVNSQPNIWGVKNFCPDSVRGETPESVEEHHKVLIDQWSLRTSQQSASIVGISMDKTFAARRHFITREIRPIKDIYDRYPFLFSWKGLRAEFLWITEFDILDTMDANLGGYQERIVKLLPLAKEDRMATSFREAAESADDPEDSSCKYLLNR